MIELLRDRPSIELITRRYPVDFDALKSNLQKDLQASYDAVLHLGQSPGSSTIKLEAIALNVAGCVSDQGEELPQLVTTGPLAYRSSMPIGRWAETLRNAHIPASVSYHAGTFLCNATMYLTHHWHQNHLQEMPIGFVHLPLATEQVALTGRILPSLPKATLAAAIRIILDDLVTWQRGGSNHETRLA